MVGYKVTKDNGLIVHTDITTVNDDIRSANVSVNNSTGFGEPINDLDLAFAACREPVAHFLTYGVAADVTDKWFYIDDLDTKNPDVDLDNNIQTILNNLFFREALTEALTQARIYGKSLIVGGFDDVKTVAGLRAPLKPKSLLLEFNTFPKTVNGKKINPYTVEQKDVNLNSLRYGKPEVYKIDRGDGQLLYVHHTRCIEVDNKFSALMPIYDDVVCGRNIRWGAAQWLYRFGGGFPVLSFPEKTDLKKLEEYVASGVFSDLMNRSYICLVQNSSDKNDGMTLDFKGAAGSALNPIPFFKSNIEQISIATGIPQAKLVGAQAGAVTGSDVNMQDYFKVISRIQNGVSTRIVRHVITWLAESGQIQRLQVTSDNLVAKVSSMLHGDFKRKNVKNFAVVWNSAFELSDIDKAKIELDHVRANQIKLDYMLIDEVRAEEDLEALPENTGKQLKGNTLSQLFESPTNNTSKQQPTPNEQLQQSDKFLLIDLKPKPRRVKAHQHET